MGKGQKELQTKATQRSDEQYATGNAASKRLTDGSEEFKKRKELVARRRKAIDTGTLAEQSDFIGNRANTAERERQRSLRANTLQTGVAGLASNYADPTQIALAEKANKDEFARDSAAQNEADAAAYMAETMGMEDQLINQQIGIDQNMMSSAWGNSNNNMQLASQIAAQRASIMPAILGGAIQAGASMAGAWFSKK